MGYWLDYRLSYVFFRKASGLHRHKLSLREIYLALIVPSIVLSRFPTFSLIFSYSSFYSSHAKGTMNESFDPLHSIPVSYNLSYGPLLSFSKVLWQVSITGGSGKYSIAHAVYSNSEGIVNSASETGFRGTYFRVMPAIVSDLWWNGICFLIK